MEKLVVTIETEQDVVIVRKQAGERAQQMGFDELACAQVALGVSEIAQNVVRYGEMGKATISTLSKNRVLRIEIADKGEGFDNVEEVRQEGFSSDNSSLGVGLSVADRAFDLFTIDSVPGVGTTVVLEKYLPFPPECIRYGSVSLMDERYEVNGDVFLIKEFDGDKILLAVIDGVGQGKVARTLANCVLTVINNKYHLPLDEILLACDRRLRKDELEGGATIALALIEADTLYYIGIGDTHSYLHTATNVTFLQNQDGRLGEFQLPTLEVRKYPLTGLTNIILCTDGINTHLHEKLLTIDSDPQQQANYIFNTYHRLYGDATVLIAQHEIRALMKDNFTETYDFLVSIIGSAPYGVIAIDLDGSITMCNKLALNQLSIPHKAKEVVESALINYTKKIPKLHKRLIECLDKGRKAFNINNVIIEEKTLNIKGRPILNGMIITTSDITEAKAMERRLMSAVLEGQENERRRLAKEIHDGIGPLMSTIKLNIESVKKEMDDASDKTLKKMEAMEELVQNVATDIRGISHALMPAALKDFGLIPALENLILKINNLEEINIQLFHSGMEQRLDEVMELGLYRITQELINNALKYANAKTMTIQVVKHPQNITLTVEDDGVGFEKEKTAALMNTGIGLRNIKARTDVLRGTLAIDTSSGNGVMATIEIPISPEVKT